MSQEQPENNTSFIQGSEPLPLDSTETQPITIPNTTEFFNSLFQSASQGTIPKLISAGTEEALNHFSDSPKITDDQRTALGKNRPGLTLTPGMSLSGAKYLANKYDTARQTNIISENGNPDFLGRMSQISGGLLGSASDIPGLAAAAAAPELVGLSRAETLTGLADRAVQRAKFGALEGAAFTIPGEAAQAVNDNVDGSPDSFDGIQAQVNIGENMFLGGALHPIGGLLKDKLDSRLTDAQRADNPTAAQDTADTIDAHSPIDPDTANSASQAAVGQMMNGKDVNVGPIIQQGAAKADADLANNVKASGMNVDQVISALDESQLELNKKLAISNNETNLETLKSRLNQAQLQKSDLPDELKTIVKNPPIKDIGVGLPQMREYYNSEINDLLSKQTSVNLSPEESSYLKELQDNKSKMDDWVDQTQNLETLPNEDLNNARNQVEQMQSQLEQTKLQPELSDDLLDQKLTETEAKINELNPLVKGVEDKDVFPSQKLKDLVRENNELREQHTVHSSLRDSLSNPTEPIDEATMNRYLDEMKTSKGNFIDSEPLPEFSETEPVKDPKSLLNTNFDSARQKELLESRKLLPEEAEEQEAIKANEKQVKMHRKLIDAAVNCIVGNT